MIELPHPPSSLAAQAQLLQTGSAVDYPAYAPPKPVEPILSAGYIKAMGLGVAMLLQNEAAREQGPTTEQLKSFIKSVMRELRDEEAPHHEFT